MWKDVYQIAKKNKMDKDGLYRSDKESSYTSRGEVDKRLREDEASKSLEKSSVRVEKTKPPLPLSFDEHIDRILRLQEIKAETGLWKDQIEVKVSTGNLPHFYFRPLSDMHIGAAGVETALAREFIRDLKKYPLFTAAVGDIGDFFSPMKHPEAMMGDVITPDDQLSAVRRFFEEYKDSILTTVQDPSHTDWIRQTSGIEPQRYLVENLGIPALINGGIMHLFVNDIEYRVLMFHQIGQYKSTLNITNAHKRMLDMLTDGDVVIAGHTHIGELAKLVKRDKKVNLVQMGTFKTKDDFGNRLGLAPNPQVFFPTLMFNGKRKNVEVVEDREEANEMIKALVHYYQSQTK